MKPRMVVAGIVCAVLLGVTAAGAQAQAFVTYEPTSTVAVAPGHETPVNFVFHVQQGYHINSNQPTTPELIPTQVHFSLPGEIAIGRVQYPAGQLTSFPFDPTQKLSVYSGDVIIRALVIAPQGSPSGAYTIHGELKYQPCDNNACYPPKKLAFSFNAEVSREKRAPHGSKELPHP